MAIDDRFIVRCLSFRGDEAEMGGQDGCSVFGGNELFCCYSIADGFQGVAHEHDFSGWIVQHDNQFFHKNRIGVC